MVEVPAAVVEVAPVARSMVFTMVPMRQATVAVVVVVILTEGAKMEAPAAKVL